MSMEFSFNLPIAIEFGRGSSKKVGEVAKLKGWKKAVIITDEGVVKAGLLSGIKESLEGVGIEYTVWDKVVPNPTDVSVEEAADFVKEYGADFLIAIGGGSSMDTAKSAALLVTNGGRIRDYETKAIEKHLLPLVTIPTTAGTGSEVDFWAVVTDTERKFKMALGQAPPYPGGPYLGATVALVDPELTKTLPPKLTASTGIDALSHAIETYVATDSKPFLEPIDLHVISTIWRWLPVAYAYGENMTARDNMMYASMMAGVAENFANCGAIHSLAESLGGIHGEIPHGVAIGVFFPHVMRFNAIAVPEKYVRIAETMGIDTTDMGLYEAAFSAADAVEELLDLLDMPRTLKELGIKREEIPEIAKRAIETVEIPGNPRKVTYEDLVRIAEDAYE